MNRSQLALWIPVQALAIILFAPVRGIAIILGLPMVALAISTTSNERYFEGDREWVRTWGKSWSKKHRLMKKLFSTWYDGETPEWWYAEKGKGFRQEWWYHAMRNPANGMKHWWDEDSVWYSFGDGDTINPDVARSLRGSVAWNYKVDARQPWRAGLFMIWAWSDTRYLRIRWGWKIGSAWQAGSGYTFSTIPWRKG